MHGSGVKGCSDRNQTQNWAQRNFLADVTEGPGQAACVPTFRKVLLWGPKGGHQESWRLIPEPESVLTSPHGVGHLSCPSLWMAVGRRHAYWLVLISLGVRWDLALALPDSHGLGVQKCGLLQRRTWMLLPGELECSCSGICQQHTPLAL